jgi:hypothetical protein
VVNHVERVAQKTKWSSDAATAITTTAAHGGRWWKRAIGDERMREDVLKVRGLTLTTIQWSTVMEMAGHELKVDES